MSEIINTTLGEVLEIKYGKDHKKLADGNIPLYGSGGIMRHVEKAIYDKPSIMIPRKGSLDNLFYEDSPFWTVDTLFWTKINEEIVDPKYLFYLLSLYNLSKYDEGSAVPSLTTKALNDVPISFPKDKSIQIEIRTIIESLDKKITLLRQQNQDLEELAQTLFKRWFVEFEFPNENGEPYKSSGGKMVESELGEIPVGWRLSTIGENIETIGGGTPSTTEPTFWEDGEILWYSPTDLTKEKSMYSIGSAKKITELGLQKSSAKLFPAYSLLMTSRATVGELTINTHAASTNQGFITLIPNENLSIYFLYDWLKSKLKTVHNLASGSTFPEISKTDFRNIEVLLATKEAHTEFDNIIKPIFKSIENNTKEIQSLTQLRDTLLPKLMSGELRVNI